MQIQDSPYFRSLTSRHARVDAALRQELASVAPNFVRVQALKKEKLWLKDRLGRAMSSPPSDQERA